MDLQEGLALVVAGVLIGTYATAIGAGGGFLLAPLLLLLYPDAPPVAITTASLTVVVVTATASTAVMSQERLVDIPLVLAIAAFGIPTAILGGMTTALVPREVFALGFAVLVLVIGVYLIWQPVAQIAPPSTRSWRREIVDRSGQRYLYRVPVLRGFPAYVSGVFVGTLAGIGGGPIGMPVMTRVLRVPHPIASTSVQALIILQSGSAVLMHLAVGNQGAPMESVPWLAVGGIVAAPLGRGLRRRLGEGPLTRALAFGLIFIAARTAWSAFA